MALVFSMAELFKTIRNTKPPPSPLPFAKIQNDHRYSQSANQMNGNNVLGLPLYAWAKPHNNGAHVAFAHYEKDVVELH